MKPKKIKLLGLPLDSWENQGCVATFGVGRKWACLYSIDSSERGKGFAINLLKTAKKYYENLGKKVNGSVPLNPIMKHIYDKLGYDYKQEDS